MVTHKNPFLSLRRKLMKRIKLTLLSAMAVMLPLAGATSAFAQIDQDTELSALAPKQESSPKTPVNKLLVGWHEARIGADGSRVGDTLRANWVMLNEADGIDGRVVGINDPIDVFLLRNGFVVGTATTKADGSYRMESASPGLYTMVGFSPEAIFATGFLAVANDGEAIDLPRSLVNVPVIGRDNNKLIAKLIQEHAPEVTFREYGTYDIGEGQGDPPQFFGWNGLRDLTEPAIPSNTIQDQPVTLGPGGTFIGRIHQTHNLTGRPVEVVNTRVMIIQDGEIIAETQVDNAGVFEFSDLIAGEYGVISVGADGIATLGIDLVHGSSSRVFENSSASTSLSGVIHISATRIQEGGGSFDATMIGPESTGWLNNYVTEQTYIIAMNEPLPGMNNMGQMPYNYFNQGGMGGGGGSGGGGYFGGGDWLLPIGIGALIYAATDNNNNLNAPIILASPF